MDKQAAPLTAKAKRTKDLIYRTALEMLSMQGYKAVTIRDICNQAGVSSGAFYRYFESKQSILFEVIREMDHYFTDVAADNLRVMEFPENILAYFRSYADYLERNISFDTLCVLMSVDDMWLWRERPTQLVLISMIQDAQLQGALRSDIPASQISVYLFSMVRGIVLNWCSTNSDFRLYTRIESFVRLALTGMVSAEHMTGYYSKYGQEVLNTSIEQWKG